MPAILDELPECPLPRDVDSGYRRQGESYFIDCTDGMRGYAYDARLGRWFWHQW
ncbi:MAG: hypothetical protein QM765_28665 [Myxococcales bacterium]